MVADTQSGHAGKPASRTRILAAARDLFVGRGYHDTRPQDIARAAGVGHGTFYLHFSDKRDCFMAFVDEAARQLDREINAALEGTHEFRDQIRAILTAILRYAEGNPGVLQAAIIDTDIIARDAGSSRESSLERWAHNWERRLSIHAREGLVDRSFNFRIIGWSLSGMLHEVTELSTRFGVDKEEIISNLTEFIVRGLSPRRNVQSNDKNTN